MDYHLDTIRIFVKDWDSSIEFYEKKMKMKFIIRNDNKGWGQIKIGKNVFLGLQKVNTNEKHVNDLVGRFVGISLQVENIYKVYQSLKLRGVIFIEAPKKQYWGGTLAHFKDNNDNILTLIENK